MFILQRVCSSILSQKMGNARDVRNLFEKIVAAQADRVAGLEDPSDEDISTITVEDLKELMDVPLEEETAEDAENEE